MLHACVQRFDVTENLEKIDKNKVELNRAYLHGTEQRKSMDQSISLFFSLGWADNYSLVQRIRACTPTGHSAVDGRTD
jgi:hypothetical protein